MKFTPRPLCLEFKKYRTLGLESYKSELSFPLDSTPIYSGRAACDETSQVGHVADAEHLFKNTPTCLAFTMNVGLDPLEFKKYKTHGLESYKSELSFPLDSAPVYSGRAACDEASQAGHVADVEHLSLSIKSLFEQSTVLYCLSCFSFKNTPSCLAFTMNVGLDPLVSS
ncbi:hypothetical protein Fmac_024700 [Flemingia macrophylla]|uniref:Uncharacterized protein n=1 Tax=Flemingia macrophylla TaxID=520843 RepID=A0ABD1LQ45_9FABA